MKKGRFILLVLIALLFTLKINAQTTKYQVAYLYNFTNYIEWPVPYRTGNFVIGVLGKNEPIINDLNNLAKTKKIHGQQIEILTFSSPEELSKCHILIVPRKYVGKIDVINAKLAGKNTLLVSDMAGAVSKGTAINFVLKGGKLNFELDAKNAEKFGLKVSSALVQLALKS